MVVIQNACSWEENMEKELKGLEDGFKRVMKSLHDQRLTLFEERRTMDEEKKKASELEKMISRQSQDRRITLDVGGRQFQTTLQTLTSETGSMLEAMFGGRFAVMQEQDQAVFLDRDPTHFETILNYLRDKNMNKELSTFCDIQTIAGRERLRLLREVSYYGIEGLKKLLEHPTLIVSQDQTLLERMNDELDDLPEEGRKNIFFSTIREAIRAATKGCRIIVCPGVYNESLTIDKSITICGYRSMEHIVIRSNENVVVSSARNVVLQRLTLRQLGGKYNGILAYEGMLTTEHCDVCSTGLGCFAIRSAHAVLRYNKIHDSPQGGMVFCEGAEGLVEFNQIYGNGLQGIEVREGSKPLVRNNQIYNSEQNGILIHSKGKGEFVGNEIFNNKIDGIMVISEASPSCIMHNHIHHNRQRGIFISHDSNGNGIDPEQNQLQGNVVNFVQEQLEQAPG
mmetsp:Transcript_111104/g.192683  ORF Transcript_111104/g.192683 Transcript_111104/m.192683 type:complete len:453 (-) Transcript_111104:744-2102(-)